LHFVHEVELVQVTQLAEHTAVLQIPFVQEEQVFGHGLQVVPS
jgi:hypothetical protein